jgi:hypothetical protein
MPNARARGVHSSTRRCGPRSLPASGMDEIYESEGPRRYLDRFLAEYGPTEEHVRDRIKVDTHEPWVSSAAPEEEYVVHESLLRSHGEFLCAGDNEALVFCREIAEEMVRAFGISPTEAVARVNRQWSEPGPSGRFPRTWIVGLNLAYHQTPDDWAGDIYYGKDSHWWRPESDPRPLPPP